MAVAIEPLRGKALLSKLKEIPTLSKSEKAKACGYVTRAKDKERANLSEFIEAILEAQGLTVEPEQAGGRGRTPTYQNEIVPQLQKLDTRMLPEQSHLLVLPVVSQKPANGKVGRTTLSFSPMSTPALFKWRHLLPEIILLNNVVEQDHRNIKRIVKPMMGFKTFNSARRTLSGH
jgi:hypothetical protein